MLLTLFKSRHGATVVVAGIAATAAVGTAVATGTSQHGLAAPSGVAATAAVGQARATGTGAVLVAPGGAGAPWPRPVPVSVRVAPLGVAVTAAVGSVTVQATHDELLVQLAAAVGALVARHDEHDDRLREIATVLSTLVTR